MSDTTADFCVTGHGLIVLLEPTTPEARAHLEEHTDGMWFGSALAIEPGNVDGLVYGLQSDGFTVGPTWSHNGGRGAESI
jgi:hypothetical protein